MNKRQRCFIVGCVVFFGCDVGTPSNATIQLPQLNAVDESLPNVTHPEYANWSQFAEKSFVVRKRVVSNAGGNVLVTTKSWLEKKDENGVSVGSRVTVERPNEPIVENDDDFVSYPPTYRLPKGMDPASFAQPSSKAKETGTEMIQIGERKIETKIFEWEERNETGPMSVKLWRSDDIPGKIVRQEMFTKSTDTKSVEEVTEFDSGSVVTADLERSRQE